MLKNPALSKQLSFLLNIAVIYDIIDCVFVWQGIKKLSV